MPDSPRTYRILVVDDEKNIRDGSERVLIRLGHQVALATQGEEALALMARQPADVVLLDLKMPGMDGLEVLGQLRNLFPDTLVIIVTGFATIETAIEAMKTGAYDLMTKPFRPEQLRHVVSRAIEHLTLRDELDRLTAEKEKGLWAITTEKSRLKTVVNSIIAGILITELDKRIVMCNPAFGQMLRVEPETIIGTMPSQHTTLGHLDQMITEVLNNSPNNEDITREFVLTDGRPTYLRATASLVTSETGSPLGLVTVVRDVTYLKEQEKEKVAFIAMLTHELRSPLGAVDAQFHVILKGLAGQLTAKQQDLLGRMRKRILNVQEMITNLLDLSRIETGQFVHEKKLTDLCPIVQETVEMLSGPAGEKNITLEMQFSEQLPRVMADPGAMKDVVNNLVSNALRYTPAGGQVMVSLNGENSALVLKVSDNGLGIAPEYHQKIFERFFRVKDPRGGNVVGTGLGLPIVKAIVQDHQGVIEVDSAVGRGSTFTVRLPAPTA